MTEPDRKALRTAEAAMCDAIEYTLWQDLADALNRLNEWGPDPLLGVADKLAVNGIALLDPVEAHHKYQLQYVPPFTPDPERPGHNKPFGWTVVEREASR